VAVALVVVMQVPFDCLQFAWLQGCNLWSREPGTQAYIITAPTRCMFAGEHHQSQNPGHLHWPRREICNAPSPSYQDDSTPHAGCSQGQELLVADGPECYSLWTSKPSCMSCMIES
jgi:hypothetical protein